MNSIALIPLIFSIYHMSRIYDSYKSMNTSFALEYPKLRKYYKENMIFYSIITLLLLSLTAIIAFGTTLNG